MLEHTVLVLVNLGAAYDLSGLDDEVVWQHTTGDNRIGLLEKNKCIRITLQVMRHITQKCSSNRQKLAKFCHEKGYEVMQHFFCIYLPLFCAS